MPRPYCPNPHPLIPSHTRCNTILDGLGVRNAQIGSFRNCRGQMRNVNAIVCMQCIHDVQNANHNHPINSYSLLVLCGSLACKSQTQTNPLSSGTFKLKEEVTSNAHRPKLRKYHKIGCMQGLILRTSLISHNKCKVSHLRCTSP